MQEVQGSAKFWDRSLLNINDYFKSLDSNEEIRSIFFTATTTKKDRNKSYPFIDDLNSVS